MKKIIRLTESELINLVKKIIKEDGVDNDYDVAIKFAKNMEDWWEGSSNLFSDPEPIDFKIQGKSYKEFFEKYQRTWDDEDNAAAIAFQRAANAELGSKVGEKNKYYYNILKWIEQIADKIDDSFQSECYLNLSSDDGRADDFMVDPEIDV